MFAQDHYSLDNLLFGDAMKNWNDNKVRNAIDCQKIMCFASSSWCKCFNGSCTYSLYGANKLFDMVVGMRIIVVGQQFNLVPNVCGS
jgi:hypothetical protein